MRKAVDEDVLTANPCAGIKLPTIRKKRKLHTTTDEAQVIGAKLRADYKDAIDLLLETGLRPSELCGLHRHHVDVENMRIDVELVYVARKKVMRPWPKDKDARRVPLTREGLSIIRRRLDGRDLTEGCGVRHSDDSVCTSPLIFLTELGRPMNVQQLGNRMRYAAAAHKVPKRTPYSARRGFSTRAARGGMDAFAIAEVMGHADVKQTQEYVQDERIGPLMRAALGDRDPLMVVEGGHEGEVPDVHVRDRLTPHGEVPYGSAHGRHRTLDHRPGG
jgi:integrase